MTTPPENQNYASSFRPPLEIEEEEVNLNSGSNLPNASRKQNRRYIVLNTLCSRISICCQKWSGKLLLALFALTIIFLIISVAHSGVKRRERLDPPEPLTIIDHHDPREDDIINKLFVISGEAIYQKGSPQYNATHWILNQDVMTVRGTDPFLMQRFIMAILYFQRKGGSTKSWGAWLNIAGSECFWDGVTCDADGHVEGIKLDDHDLVGAIPTEMGKLKQLKNLDLSSNYLTGVIPTEVGALNKLESLILNHNVLIGTVPPQLCSLRDSGTLSVLITNCEELVKEVTCDCCTNCGSHESGTGNSGSNIVRPTGSPYAGSSPGNGVQPLTGKEKLIYNRCAQISGDAITLHKNRESPQNFAMHWMINDDKSILGVDSLYFVQRYVMAVMYFSLCEESWQFNSWLSPIESECSFKGVTCDANEIITKLTFENMRMIGRLPPEISQLTRVTFMDFSKNDINGEIPDAWSHLTNIVILNFSDNRISGTVPLSLCNLRFDHSLESVAVDCNKVSCNPECCPNCSDEKLSMLTPAENSVRPTDSTNEGSSIGNDRFPVPAPRPVLSPIVSSTEIVHVDVTTLYHPEEVRQELQKVSALPDYVPNELRTRAQDWIIEDNDSKRLSPTSQHLKERYILVVLYFVLDGDNWTSTTDSDQWTSMTSNTMWLSANTNVCLWGGVLCDTDSDFVVGLDLPSENLRGPIPHELSHLYHLQNLNLSSNHLTRSIPNELGQLDKLGSLILHSNEMTGEVPTSVCMLREQGVLQQLWVDCDRNDVHRVTCPIAYKCCTRCGGE